MSIQKYIHSFLPVLFDIPKAEETIHHAVNVMVHALQNEKPILVCGNGGSAADAQHIAGELVGRYLKERSGLNVICLSDNPTILTALGNDYGYASVFSRQVEAYGKQGGVLLGISTSGNSENVVNAFEVAKKTGLHTIALTGKGGGKLAPLSDTLITANSQHTPLIQQAHIIIYHYMCEKIENAL